MHRLLPALILIAATPLTATASGGAPMASDPVSAAEPATLADPLDCAIPTYDDRCEAFATSFDGGDSGWNFLTDMSISPSGHRVYVTGQAIGNLFDTVVAVYDTATGDPITEIRWDGGNSNENPHDAEVSPDGGTLYVTGAVIGRRSEIVGGVKYGYYDFGTVAFDVATGRESWVAIREAPALGVGASRASALSSDGELLYVAGEMTTPGSGLGSEARDFVTIAYVARDEEHPERIGTELWSARFNGARFDDVTDIALSGDDRRLFVTGTANNDGVTVAYDALTGAQLWSARIIDGRSVNDDVEVSPDGARVFVSGMRGEVGAGDGSSRASVQAYDAATGAALWSDVTAPTIEHNAAARTGGWTRALRVSADGTTVFHAGAAWVASARRENELYAIALDAATGARRWERRHLAPVSSEAAAAMTISPSGDRIFLTGHSGMPGGGCDAFTLSIAADDGEQLWAARYPWPREPVGPCNAGRQVHAVSSASRVLVGGSITNLADQDEPFGFGLLGYDL